MATKARNRNWKTTEPSKRTARPVKLRFEGPGVKVSTGDFYWSDTENAFLECREGKDGLGLYAEHGWKVLGWK